MNEELTIEEMRYILAEYFEDAGFKDVYKRELINWDEKRIKEAYAEYIEKDEK